MKKKSFLLKNLHIKQTNNTLVPESVNLDKWEYDLGRILIFFALKFNKKRVKLLSSTPINKLFVIFY